MGCTSSAPNMVNSSPAGKSIQSEGVTSYDQSKDIEEIIYRADDTDEITVLPSSDNLAENNVHLVRNISSSSLATEKDSQEYKHFSEVLNKTDSSDKLHEEENPLKLEQVVGKVVELHSSENIIESQPDKSQEESQKSQHNGDKQNLTESNVLQDNEENSDGEQDEQKGDHPEEAVSPSQSQSSRATRWEALADVAAELPPSLTVDPITGQIYSLSK